MITIRLKELTHKQLLRLTAQLKDRTGLQLNPTNAVRYAIDYTLKRLINDPNAIFETKRCGDCDTPLKLRIVNGVDQLFCPKCGEVK